MQIISADNSEVLDLGRRGENLARRVAYDFSDWAESYGSGSVQLLAQRPGDEAPYPVSLAVEGTTAYWELSSADTAKPGYGKAELQYYVDETCVKSKKYQTYVAESLGEPGDAPEPYQGWVEKVLQAGADLEQAEEQLRDVAEKLDAAAENAYGLSYYPGSVSGAVASFSNGAEQKALTDLTISIQPVQTGSGDPSSENLRPITGWTAAKVMQRGKNLLDPTIDTAFAGVTYQSQEDGTLLCSGTKYGNDSLKFDSFYLPKEQYYLSKRLVSGSITNSSTGAAYSPYLYINDSGNRRSSSFTASGGSLFFEFITNRDRTEYADAVYEIQVELGSTASGFEPYRGRDYEIAFPEAAGTVYGGSLDVTAGILTVTHACISSYNGEELPGAWISDRDVYSAGGAPSTGAQVVYELAEPLVYQLTPQELTIFSGVNNIYADCGDVAVEYPADPWVCYQQLRDAVTALGGKL